MNAIVVVDRNWGIGKDGDQQVYLKEDLKRFKALTMGHAVILGRKTLATCPGGRPLPKRRNLVLSRSAEFAPDGAEVFHNLESLLAAAPEDAFVIGGGSVYTALLERCDRVYVTQIHGTFPADTYFPNLDENPDWEVEDRESPLEQDGLAYHYVTYRRLK